MNIRFLPLDILNYIASFLNAWEEDENVKLVCTSFSMIRFSICHIAYLPQLCDWKLVIKKLNGFSQVKINIEEYTEKNRFLIEWIKEAVNPHFKKHFFEIYFGKIKCTDGLDEIFHVSCHPYFKFHIELIFWKFDNFDYTPFLFNPCIYCHISLSLNHIDDLIKFLECKMKIQQLNPNFQIYQIDLKVFPILKEKRDLLQKYWNPNELTIMIYRFSLAYDVIECFLTNNITWIIPTPSGLPLPHWEDLINTYSEKLSYFKNSKFILHKNNQVKHPWILSNWNFKKKHIEIGIDVESPSDLKHLEEVMKLNIPIHYKRTHPFESKDESVCYYFNSILQLAKKYNYNQIPYHTLFPCGSVFEYSLVPNVIS